jgi:hypothetical protein
VKENGDPIAAIHVANVLMARRVTECLVNAVKGVYQDTRKLNFVIKVVYQVLLE